MVGRPVHYPERRLWYCPVLIEGSTQPRIRPIFVQLGTGAHGLGRPAFYETIHPRAHAVALVCMWHMTYWVLCCGAWDLLGPKK
jgi:hypothetical protein